MRNALKYLLSPVWHGLGSRGFVASIVLLALVMQSYAWASQPCHVVQHLQHSEMSNYLHTTEGHAANAGSHASEHRGLMTSATMADHAHDHVSSHTGHSDQSGESHEAQFISVLMLGHNCPACSACCLAAAVFGDGGVSGLLDLRDPGPPAAIVLAQPLPPHDPPFHPPRLISLL